MPRTFSEDSLWVELEIFWENSQGKGTQESLKSLELTSIHL
jgi:hypothetical protein